MTKGQEKSTPQPQLFVSKHVEKWALQWDGSNIDAMRNFAGIDDTSFNPYAETIVIRTLEGWLTASKGDWIVKGVRGEFYPCKPDIFESSYELRSVAGGESEQPTPNESMLEYWLKDYAQFRPNWWPLIEEYLKSLPAPPQGKEQK